MSKLPRWIVDTPADLEDWIWNMAADIAIRPVSDSRTAIIKPETETVLVRSRVNTV